MTIPSKSKFFAALIALFGMVSTAAYACWDNSGSTTVCATSRNFIVICSWNSIMLCTGSYAGSPHANASSGAATGVDDYSTSFYGCAVTATASGTCCGGAVTSWGVIGVDTYTEAYGSPCPGA